MMIYVLFFLCIKPTNTPSLLWSAEFYLCQKVNLKLQFASLGSATLNVNYVATMRRTRLIVMAGLRFVLFSDVWPDLQTLMAVFGSIV